MNTKPSNLSPALRELVEPVEHFAKQWPSHACVYCDSLSPHHQWDHFPVPGSMGGTLTVRACVHCHNMKDRVTDKIAIDFLSFGTFSDMPASDREADFILRGDVPSLATLMMLFSDFPTLPPPIRVLAARRVRQLVINFPSEVPV